MQRPLARPVAPLHGRLGGVRAAVKLEVQLAHHHRAPGGRRGKIGEELVGGALPRTGHPLQVGDPAQRLEHVGRRPSPTVAVAEHEQARGRVVVIQMVAGIAPQLLHLGRRVVGVGRRKVRQHPRAVGRLPVERVVLGPGEAVPRELLGEEPVDAGAAHDLRKLGVVPEHVGVPELTVAAAELALEVPLAVQELTYQRLARRQVAVRLDPRAATRHPLPRRNPLADARVELGLMQPQPVVLVGLRAGESELRIPLHVGELRAEGADHLAMGLGQRPQPRGVDVRVPDGGQLVGDGAVAGRQQVVQDLAGRFPGGAVVLVPGVAEAVQLRQQPPGPGGVEVGVGGTVGLQPAQHVQVVVKPPGERIKPGQHALVEHHRFDRLVHPLQLAELAVAGEFDTQIEPLSARGPLQQQRVGARAVGAGVETLRRPAVDPERRLAV